MKIGLDDYLCEHSIEEFEALPTEEVKSLSEQITMVTQENYYEFLPKIADLEDEIQKEILCKALSKKIDVNYRNIRSAVTAFEKTDSVITNSNIIIAHPSFDIKNDFAVIGFRETVVINNEPQERNFYLISTNDSYILHEDKVLQLNDKHIIFDERDRFLLRVDDRWSKERIINFIRTQVSPTGAYDEIKHVLKQYVEFQKDAVYGLVTAWIIATYFFLIFHAFPFLFIYGKKQSGKSRMLDLLERLAFNAMKVKGISVASMADSIDGVKGTFLNDQAESLSDSRNAEILGILADSYTPGGGKRRIVDISNKKRRILEFSTYAPKAFASIKEIDSDLKDRCIEINMLRAVKDYPYPEAFLPIWHDVRDKLYRLLLTRWKDVSTIYQSTGEGVTHRVRELWRPIETILRLENVPKPEMQGIKEFFLESMMETQTELTESEIEVFDILLELLEGTGESILTVQDITQKMTVRPHEEMTDKGLQTWAGKILRQFSLYNQQAGRKNNKRAYRFSYDHVKDVFDRYHITGGTGGEVDKAQELNENADTTSENVGGSEVVNTTCLKSDATYKPPLKNEVVTNNPLLFKESNHLTTSITYPETYEVIEVLEVSE